METDFTLYRTKNRPGGGIILWACRLFVGMLFIFSGLIKANDPTGFGYKLQEYFHVLNMGFLNDYATWLAVFVCGFEIVLGAFLLLGLYGRKVAWGLLLLIVFFTFLTFYSAFFEVVSSCGCFGDAIPLTPWQSFLKDLVLLALILVIFWHKKNIQPMISGRSAKVLTTVLVVLLSFGTGVYTVYYLPFIDFLPYKEGKHIPSQMVLPEGEKGDVYEFIYEIRDRTTGQTRKVSDTEYMNGLWEDENLEVVGEPSSRLVKKGYQIPITDLVISDLEGNDVTQDIISNPYFNFIVVSTYLDKMSTADLIALDRINSSIHDLSTDYHLRAVLLTASSAAEIDRLNSAMDLVLETFQTDAVPLKSMVRSNPGLLLLQNGTIIKKWPKRAFPDKAEIVSLIDN